MASRKFEEVWSDDRGNLYASNNRETTGPGASAERISEQMTDNVINSMVPSGNVEIGIGPGGSSGGSAGPGGSYGPGEGLGNTSGRTIISSNVRRTRAESPSGFSGSPYTPSKRVRDYRSKLGDIEDTPKPVFSSQYETRIQSILDNILSPKPFNISEDPNYQGLYNRYAQSYMAQGDKAMRDQLGATAGLTGGYGSTAAQAAASQAQANYLQGLNDQQLALYNLAYQMHSDDRADRYNQLGAVTGLDNTDYGRYRDDVGDYFNERDYWRNAVQQEYANDFNQYADARDFGRAAYESDRNFDRSVYESDRSFETAEEERDYDRFQDALAQAQNYLNKGLSVPEYIARIIRDYTGEDDLENVIASMPTGRSGGGSDRGGSTKPSKEEIAAEGENAFKRALFYSSKGYDYDATTKNNNDTVIIDMLVDYGYSDDAIAYAMNKLRGTK